MEFYEANYPGKRRIKNKNWTTIETTLLIDMCISNIEIVNGEGDKSPFWDEAAKAINALGICVRTPHEAKRKWIDLKSLTKKKEQARKKAQRRGTEEPPPLTDLEKRVLCVLPGHVLADFDSDSDTCTDLGIVKIEKEDPPSHSEEELTIGKAIRVIVENGEGNSSKTSTAAERLSPAEDSNTKTPVSVKRKFDDFEGHRSCSCSRHLLIVEQSLLRESKRRNSLLERLTNQMDAVIKLKIDKIALLRRMSNIEPEDSGGESSNP